MIESSVNKSVAIGDSPQAFLCKNLSLQNLCLTIPDSLRKNFDYHKLSYGEHSYIREYSTATCFLISCIPLLLYIRNVLLLETEKRAFLKAFLLWKIL